MAKIKYPEVTAGEWLKKYPGIEQLKYDCKDCGKSSIADTPFISGTAVGLIGTPCDCENPHLAVSYVEIHVQKKAA